MKKTYYKNTIAAIFALVLCLTLTTAVHANDDAPPNTDPTIKKLERPAKTPSVRNTDKMASKEAELRDKMEKAREKMATREAAMKDKMASRAAEKFEDRCKMLSEKTSQTLTRYESNKTKHIENYTQAKKRLEEVIAKLKKDGADTTKLEADLKQLDTLIKKASDDYAAFITSLKETKNFACGKSEGAYANALKASREKLMTARQSIMAIRTFYQTTVRTDIQAVRAQMPSRSPRASSTARPRVSASPVATNTASPQTQ